MTAREKVILWNQYGHEAVWGERDADMIESEIDDPDYEFGREGFEQFVSKHTFLGYKFLADPAEMFYQGIDFMSVWERKSDGKKFGYKYWQMGGKYGEAQVEGNGDSHGIDWQDPRGEAFVWVEVDPFTITGYTYDD